MERHVECNDCGYEFPAGEIHQLTPATAYCSACMDRFELKEEKERAKKRKKMNRRRSEEEMCY
jgi:hypothetical protein